MRLEFMKRESLRGKFDSMHCLNIFLDGRTIHESYTLFVAPMLKQLAGQGEIDWYKEAAMIIEDLATLNRKHHNPEMGMYQISPWESFCERSVFSDTLSSSPTIPPSSHIDDSEDGSSEKSYCIKKPLRQESMVQSFLAPSTPHDSPDSSAPLSTAITTLPAENSYKETTVVASPEAHCTQPTSKDDRFSNKPSMSSTIKQSSFAEGLINKSMNCRRITGFPTTTHEEPSQLLRKSIVRYRLKNARLTPQSYPCVCSIETLDDVKFSDRVHMQCRFCKTLLTPFAEVMYSFQRETIPQTMAPLRIIYF